MNFNKYNGNTEQETYLMKKAIRGGGPSPSGSKMYLHTIQIAANWHDPMEGEEMGELHFNTQLTISRANEFTNWNEIVDELTSHGHFLIGNGTFDAQASPDSSGLALRVLGTEQTMEIDGFFDGNYSPVERAINDDTTTIFVYDYVMEA